MSFDSNDGRDLQKNHNLLVVQSQDAVGNRLPAANDYRVLQPRQITDPNGNRSEVRFDALGMVVGTAVMGKATGPVEGDSFDSFTVDLTPQQIADSFDATDPRPLAVAHLGTATTRILYDLDRVPACAASIARETHVSDLAGRPADQGATELRLLRRLWPRDPEEDPGRAGPCPARDAAGDIILGADGQPQMTATTSARAGSAAAGRSSTTKASPSASSSPSSPTPTASSSRSASA